MKQHIQVGDRGITLSKSLAWTIVAGLVGAAVWLGIEVGNTRSTLDGLVAAQEVRHAETQRIRRDTDLRLRALETARATDGGEIAALRRDLTSFREDIRDLKDILRTLERRLVQP